MTRRPFSHSFIRLAYLIALAVFLPCAASLLRAQTTNVLDGSALHPPSGARVAIVEFSDLECPACAHANPTLKAAADKYHIPWIRHDTLIPGHVWSRNAAIYARWFDLQAHGLGDAYRDSVFASQTSIYNVKVLDQFTQNFARSHSIALPFAVDPQGKLAAQVEADNQLSRRTGITQTPTVFIVTARSKGAPYIKVQNVDADLYRTIDQALADTK
jgi:protein-disulfide isomerase